MHVCTYIGIYTYTHTQIYVIYVRAEISVCIGIYIEFLPCRVTRLSEAIFYITKYGWKYGFIGDIIFRSNRSDYMFHHFFYFLEI